MPSLLQNMMGSSEVARATHTPDLSIQHRHGPRLPPCHGVSLAAGLQEGPSQHGASHRPLSQQRLVRRCCLGLWAGLIRTSSLCPGTLHRPALSPPQRGVASSLRSAWDFGAQSHIPRPVAARLGPLPSSLQEKPHFIPQLPPACTPHPVPCAMVGPQHPRRVRSRWSAPFLPLSLGALGAQLWIPPCHPLVLWVSFLWRLLAGWLGPSSPWPPSFYLCWCLQFGVGSLGRQLRPVLAERCCLSLCGWTRPSLAPPRTL